MACGKAHVLFVTVCTFTDEFNYSVPMNSIAKVILNFGKEVTGRGCMRVIVKACGIDVCYLLAEPSFAESYLPNIIFTIIPMGK